MEKFCVTTEKFYVDIVCQAGGIFCHNRVFLGCNIVGQARSFLS